MPVTASKSSKPILRLFIPQLLQPLVLWNQDFLFEASAPELGQLLRQFKVTENKSIQGLDASLFNALGMVENQELPAAQYRYQTHSNLSTKNALLCADPIHLEVGMNDITLTDIISDLSESEAEEILGDLNTHFKQDGIEFVKGSHQHWYVVLANEETISTTPLNEVLRKNVAKYQPHSDSRNWQVIQNESQMILHNCAVNQQREMAGLTTVNSLWFWGGGQVIEQKDSSNTPNNPRVEHIYCNENAEINAKVAAQAAKCEFSILNNELPTFKAGETWLILDQLFSPAVHDSLDVFQQALTRLDEQIIKPLKQAWQAGEIELLIDDCYGTILKPIKPKAWKFWDKKPRLLSALAKSVKQ